MDDRTKTLDVCGNKYTGTSTNLQRKKKNQCIWRDRTRHGMDNNSGGGIEGIRGKQPAPSMVPHYVISRRRNGRQQTLFFYWMNAPDHMDGRAHAIHPPVTWDHECRPGMDKMVLLR